MAYGLIGYGLTGASAGVADYTYIELLASAPNRGILKLVDVQLSGAADADTSSKIKIFRDDGTNYVFVAEQTVILQPGVNSNIPVWLPVEKGDLIGFWCTNTSGYGPCYQLMSSRARLYGDITTTTLKSDWSVASEAFAIQGKVFARVAPL